MTELKYVRLHGELVAYQDSGHGPTLVMLHGIGSSSRTWRAVTPQLSKHFRVVAPDLLGHGESAKPRTDYSLGAFAVWLRNFLDELEIPRATIVGHSLGGGIGMQFVHQHPEYCERLALIASGGLGAEVGLSLRLLASPAAELIAPLIAPKSVVAVGNRLLSRLESVRPPQMATTETWEAYASLSDRPTRQAFLRTLRSVVDYRGQAVSARSRLDVTHGLPVSLLWGEQDPIIPVAHARAAHDALPGSRLLILPGVGHTPQLEAPAAVADFLEAFVNSTVPWTPMATA